MPNKATVLFVNNLCINSYFEETLFIILTKY